MQAGAGEQANVWQKLRAATNKNAAMNRRKRVGNTVRSWRSKGSRTSTQTKMRSWRRRKMQAGRVKQPMSGRSSAPPPT